MSSMRFGGRRPSGGRRVLLNTAQLTRSAGVAPQTTRARIEAGVVRPVAMDLHGRLLFDELALDALRATLQHPGNIEFVA
jgi:hypothetical protein